MLGIYKVEKYDETLLDSVISEIFENHKFNSLIRPGMIVCVKPNLLAKNKPSEAVTTHPLLVKAVCKKVVELGAKCIVADSPAGAYTKVALTNLYKYNELNIVEEVGAQLNYDVDYTMCNIEGEKIKNIEIINPILQADLVINMAKIKTHSMMNLTASTKNLFGIIPGTRKAEIHSRFEKYEDFANAMIDISKYITKQIIIVDGILALEGNGPSAGDPKHLGIIMAGDNQFEIDYSIMKIIGMKLEDAYIVNESIKRKLLDVNNIDVIGENIESVKCLDFKFPDTIAKKTAFKMHNLTKYIKPYPVFNKKKCKLCKICIERCPRDAIEIKNGRVRLKSKQACIRCFCCHEHCPYKAVDIKHMFSLGLKKAKI